MGLPLVLCSDRHIDVGRVIYIAIPIASGDLMEISFKSIFYDLKYSEILPAEQDGVVQQGQPSENRLPLRNPAELADDPDSQRSKSQIDKLGRFSISRISTEHRPVLQSQRRVDLG